MLRQYQHDAVNAVYNHLRTRTDNPLVVIPTGGGKTHVIKKIVEDAVDQWHGRILILAHVKELLKQAAEKLDRPDVGIYSAGLRSRDTDSKILIAGIQSVYQKAGELGPFNLILVDECHLIPLEGDGMYQQFLSDAKLVNPGVRVVGLTATPYRMKEGTVADPDHFLNHVCYEASIQELITLGYLSPVRSKAGKKKPDTDSLHVRGGEYVASEVADLMDTDQLVDAAVSEILDLTKDRHSVLVFAASVKHAMHLQTLLPDAGLVVGDTAANARDEQIEEFKRGERKFLVSVNVLSVGFDAPNVDAIAMLRPTLSPGLYYQQVGRGLRLHPSKVDCLVLDFAGNIKRHGPIDALQARPVRSGSGEGQPAPTKECPVCLEIVLAAYSKCPACNHEFTQEKPKHGSQADDAAILSSQQPPEVWTVKDVFYCVHTKKDADEFTPKTFRVDYLCGIGVKISEWVCVEHEGFAREKALLWWDAHSNDLFPQSAQHAVDIANAGGLAKPEEITVIREGKWPRVSDRKLGPKPEAVGVEHYSEDDLPF
jgi:DNA repair protein RadD